MPSLLLRQPTILDLDAAKRIHCDPETNHFNPGGVPSSEEVEKVFMSWISHWDTHQFGYWAVSTQQSTDFVIGFGGIMWKQIGNIHGLNMYFRLSPMAWGKGYASEIAQASLKFAFDELEASEVFGLVRPMNLPSRRTLEKAGFSIYTTLDDVPSAESSIIYRAIRPIDHSIV